MSAHADRDRRLQIAHVLFIDVVGYSKLLINEQSKLVAELNEIVRRHEILRTTFSSVDGQPTQVVAPSVYIPLPVVDLSEFTEREKEAQQLAAAEAQTPFDLKTGPLVRAQLLRLAAEDHILLLTMHHIMFDGWSRRILVRELATLYAAYTDGLPSSLPQLPANYAEYARWQREFLSGETLERISE